jgi:serine-type D-Ala-D-Ala carboxypeptidase/endopeptidase (penicillin-binding protein 4)
MRLRIFLAVTLALIGCKSSAPHIAATQPTTLATSRPATLSEKLTEILNRRADAGAIVSARVIDLESGKELFVQEADRPMIPASNMKLTVTAPALEYFGPDAVFETDLAISGNDLYLIGHGDPGLGDDAIADKYGKDSYAPIDAWADELIATKKTLFSGNLYFVDNAFESLRTHPTWEGELNEWYAAPVSGLNYNDNCIDAILKPADADQSPAAEVIPETSNTIVLINQATTVTGKENDVDWDRAQTNNTYTIKGNITKVTKLQSKPVTDPGAMFADAVRTRFAKKGITIGGQILRAEAGPTGEMTKLKPATTKLSDVLWRINKNSQNTLAEALAKKLGLQQRGAPGSWKNANDAIRIFFKQSNIDATGYVFADGSGLSVDNRVTIRLISDILMTMARSKNFDAFRNSMTIMGVDGTTSSRLKDLPNRVYAKTGYISHVRSLSGYAKTDGGKWRVFSIIYNKIEPRGAEATRPYTALQDEAVREILKD